MKIDKIELKIIKDSRSKDTLEAEMESGGIKVSASVPAGESTGKNEAKTIPPKQALEKADWLNSQTKDHEFVTLDQFDSFLNIVEGANLTVALSTAFCKLLAKKNNMETWQLISKISGIQANPPLCFYNVIEGGVHTQNSLPFQEYWYIPKTNSPKKSLETVMTFLKTLGEKLYGEMGSEGGYTMPSKDPEDGLKIMKEVSPDGQFGLDVAATKLPEKISLSFYQLLTTNYQLLAIEDPYPEDDWDGFEKITAALGDRVWIIADDLTTTNVARIKIAQEKNAINGVIIKPTQIGTITQTIQAANLAKSYGWKIVVANRGEETMDDFIADLSVGLGADAIKSGCPLQKERLVKYQRLVEIEKTWHT